MLRAHVLEITTKSSGYFALPVGFVFAALTLWLEKLPERCVALLIPGLIVSMALSGNVHAFPLWLAAIANGFLYFGLISAAATLITKAVTRTRR